MGFTQGISGLNGASTDLDTIGNNIANYQTVGFKSGRTEFADVFAGAQAGLGVKVSGVSQNFTAGSLNNTSRDLDVAIDGGGFFRMSDGGQVEYSRNGQFHQTKEGYVVNAQGARLTGYNVSHFNDPTLQPTVDASGTPQDIQIPPQSMIAKATQNLNFQASLDSEADTGDSWSTTASVYDSLGNGHSLTLEFDKTAPNAWTVTVSPDSGSPFTTAPNISGGNASFDVVFDSNGNLDAGGGDLTNSLVNLEMTPSNGANPINFDFDLSGTTQMAQEFNAKGLTQDGHQPGDLTGISVTKDGMIRGTYSNGVAMNLAQMAMAGFRNEQGLKPVGDNAWVETAESGQPLLGTAGTGQLGQTLGSTLEKSNVNLAKELVNMIVAQRTYQANAQTIKTQSEVLQTAVNLSR